MGVNPREDRWRQHRLVRFLRGLEAAVSLRPVLVVSADLTAGAVSGESNTGLPGKTGGQSSAQRETRRAELLHTQNSPADH